MGYNCGLRLLIHLSYKICKYLHIKTCKLEFITRLEKLYTFKRFVNFLVMVKGVSSHFDKHKYARLRLKQVNLGEVL
jgi:hypothetical protein